MIYQCSNCGYTHEKRDHIERHFKNKKKCGENLTVIEIDCDFECDICSKKYKLPSSLTRHKKTCAQKIEKKIEELEKNIQEIEKKKELKQRLEELNKKMEHLKT